MEMSIWTALFAGSIAAIAFVITFLIHEKIFRGQPRGRRGGMRSRDLSRDGQEYERAGEHAKTADKGLSETSPDPFIIPKGIDVTGAVRGRPQTKSLSPLNPVDFRFTTYHPQRIYVDLWDTVFFYAYLPELADDVRSDAQNRIRDPSVYLGSSTDPITIEKDSEVRLVPNIPGARFNPDVDRFVIAEDMHRREFRVSVNPASKDFRSGKAVNGTIAVFVYSVQIAEVPISLILREKPKQDDMGLAGLGEDRKSQGDLIPFLSSTADPFKNIFTSYSHEDDHVVNTLGAAYSALGMTCLRDGVALRSGEKWHPRLLEMIDQADIFQLYWSEAASQSDYVEREWRHALQRDLRNFVRPVYWKKPLHPVPAELSDIHFAYLHMSAHGDGDLENPIESTPH